MNRADGTDARARAAGGANAAQAAAKPPEEGRQAREHAASPIRSEDALDLLRRERADFTNYRRRVEGERASERDRATSDLVAQLLPPIDELDRALAQVPEALGTDPWVRGVAMARRALVDALARIGVERTGQEGEPFDPARHEALFFENDPGASETRVSSVVRRGYRQGDRLLRPAQVVVAGPLQTEGAGNAEPVTEQDQDGTERRDAGRR